MNNLVHREFFRHNPSDDESLAGLFESHAALSQLEAIFELETMLKQGNATGAVPATVCPVTHFFAPGVYVRQMVIPAGVATIGHIHRHPCVTMIAYGDCIITSAHSRGRYGPGATFETPAGAKRAVYALADTMLSTVHHNPDNERDPDRIFANLIVDIYQEATGEPSRELRLIESKP